MLTVPLPATLPYYDKVLLRYVERPLHDLTATVYTQLGPGMTKDDEKNGWLLCKFVDAMVEGMKPSWDMVLDHEGVPGWWSAFDPYARPGEELPWLPWLSQWVGHYYDASLNRLLTDADPETANPDQANRDRVGKQFNFKRGSADDIKQIVQERMDAVHIGVCTLVIERDGQLTVPQPPPPPPPPPVIALSGFVGSFEGVFSG